MGSPATSHTVDLTLVTLSYTTVAFNAGIARFGAQFRKFWVGWFNLGLIYAVVAWVFGLLLVAYSILTSLSHLASLRTRSEVIRQSSSVSRRGLALVGASGGTGAPMLNLMVPGINLPISHLPLYVLSFLIAGVVHELGHGLAGAAEGVPLLRFGIHFSLIYPSAFTELEPTRLSQVSLAGQLRVIAAGVWHNAILGLMASALYHSQLLSRGLLSTPLYVTPPCGALLVKWVDPNSSLVEHIRPGDLISRVNNRPVTTITDWRKELNFESLTPPQDGVCISRNLLAGVT